MKKWMIAGIIVVVLAAGGLAAYAGCSKNGEAVQLEL